MVDELVVARPGLSHHGDYGFGISPLNIQTFASNIILVRQLATKALAHAARNTESPVGIYLFNKDHLVGVKYVLKDFKAIWLKGEPAIQVFSGTELTDQIMLDSAERKAA